MANNYETMKPTLNGMPLDWSPEGNHSITEAPRKSSKLKSIVLGAKILGATIGGLTAIGCQEKPQWLNDSYERRVEEIVSETMGDHIVGYGPNTNGEIVIHEVNKDLARYGELNRLVQEDNGLTRDVLVDLYNQKGHPKYNF